MATVVLLIVGLVVGLLLREQIERLAIFLWNFTPREKPWDEYKNAQLERLDFWDRHIKGASRATDRYFLFSDRIWKGFQHYRNQQRKKLVPGVARNERALSTGQSLADSQAPEWERKECIDLVDHEIWQEYFHKQQEEFNAVDVATIGFGLHRPCDIHLIAVRRIYRQLRGSKELRKKMIELDVVKELIDRELEVIMTEYWVRDYDQRKERLLKMLLRTTEQRKVAADIVWTATLDDLWPGNLDVLQPTEAGQHRGYLKRRMREQLMEIFQNERVTRIPAQRAIELAEVYGLEPMDVYQALIDARDDQVTETKREVDEYIKKTWSIRYELSQRQPGSSKWPPKSEEFAEEINRIINRVLVLKGDRDLKMQSAREDILELKHACGLKEGD